MRSSTALVYFSISLLQGRRAGRNVDSTHVTSHRQLVG
jgi:hypothetical protein